MRVWAIKIIFRFKDIAVWIKRFGKLVGISKECYSGDENAGT